MARLKMIQSIVKHRSFVGVGVFVGCILAFQNCGQISMTQKGATNAGTSSPVLSLSQLLSQTTLNHAKTIQIETGGNASLSLDPNVPLYQQTLPNAKVTVDPTAQTLTFTPNTGFRGEVDVTLYSTYQNVTNVQNIEFQVENPTLDFQPALAVRGAQCILCHANLQGDLISDFGYKTATEKGPDLFLSLGEAGLGDSAYGIARPTDNSLSYASIVGKLAVPHTDFTTLDTSITRSWYPNNPLTLTPAITTLAGWISAYQLPTNVGFAGVVEQNSVYIGAPSVSDIVSAGALNASTRMAFFPNTVTDPQISGLTHIVNATAGFDYYTNTNSTTPVACEGDLFIDGVVFLNHVSIQTTYGCRIYATHSVFINGAITYTNVRALSNLEVTSAVGVYMGFGYCVDCADATPVTSFGYVNQSTLTARWNQINGEFAVKSFRSATNAQMVGAAEADYRLVSLIPPAVPTIPAGQSALALYQANGVNLLDASNSFVNEGSTTYGRLLLNAPVVMSRYSGDFQGIVIAEFAMWRLGAFTFNFDPVFTGVPLLPFLDFTTILNIE